MRVAGGCFCWIECGDLGFAQGVGRVDDLLGWGMPGKVSKAAVYLCARAKQSTVKPCDRVAVTSDDVRRLGKD